jgi:hypothetical protein
VVVKMVEIMLILGNFDCVIPPHPFPQDVIASRAIFKLHSFYIVAQTQAQRATGVSRF